MTKSKLTYRKERYDLTSRKTFLSFSDRRQKFLSKVQFSIAFILAFALIVCSGIPTFAADSVEYVERSVDANGNVVSTTKTATKYTQVTSITKEWQNSNWYYAVGKIAINSKVTVNGDVHLILKKAASSLLQKVFMCRREAVSQFTVSLMATVHS